VRRATYLRIKIASDDRWTSPPGLYGFKRILYHADSGKGKPLRSMIPMN